MGSGRPLAWERRRKLLSPEPSRTCKSNAKWAKSLTGPKVPCTEIFSDACLSIPATQYSVVPRFRFSIVFQHSCSRMEPQIQSDCVLLSFIVMFVNSMETRFIEPIYSIYTRMSTGDHARKTFQCGAQNFHRQHLATPHSKWQGYTPKIAYTLKSSRAI